MTRCGPLRHRREDAPGNAGAARLDVANWPTPVQLESSPTSSYTPRQVVVMAESNRTHRAGRAGAVITMLRKGTQELRAKADADVDDIDGGRP